MANNDRRMSVQQWKALAALTLARSRSARRTVDDDWSNLSVAEIIRREKARIRKEDAKRLAREKVLSAMVKSAEQGNGSLTPKEIVQDWIDRADAQERHANPLNRNRYDDLHTPPKKRW